jgi:hypothetical protein
MKRLVDHLKARPVRALQALVGAVIIFTASVSASPAGFASPDSATSESSEAPSEVTVTLTSDDDIGPLHVITCDVQARTPSKSSNIIQSRGWFKCTSAPDVCYAETELQIWDTYDKKWIKAARGSTGNCDSIADGRWVYAQYNCSSPYKEFSWKTKAHFEAFHGTWTTATTYSSSVKLSC